ncbi:hypothetical protein LSAT2_008545 [Lamellibrachia satsuma]|nr:hypothetical protein LSAT2_008545 [Lamellibrachia satsuma]
MKMAGLSSCPLAIWIGSFSFEKSLDAVSGLRVLCCSMPLRRPSTTRDAATRPQSQRRAAQRKLRQTSSDITAESSVLPLDVLMCRIL